MILTDNQRLFAIFALCGTMLSFGIAFGGVLPWIALSLEAKDTHPLMIGLVSAGDPLGVMVMAPFVYRLAQRFGIARTAIFGALGSSLSIALLGFFDSAPAWLLLRIAAGFAGALPWVVTETWLNMVAKSEWRGRVMAVYGAAFAAGVAAGPVVLSFTGTEGNLPILVFTSMALVSIVPLILVRQTAPTLDQAPQQNYFAIVKSMPLVFAAVAVSATVDLAFVTFLPIWGERLAMTEREALLLLTFFVSGSILFQYPMGMLADRFGVRLLMWVTGSFCLIGPLLVFGVLWNYWLLALWLFIWGGMAWSLYTLALAEMGHRVTGSVLAAANGAVVFIYTLSNMTGPPLAGLALDQWPPHGFMVVSFVGGLAFLALLAWQSRRSQP